MHTLPMTVAEGAKFLDSVDSDWASKIDLDKLDMKHQSNCIFGQLYEDYATGMNKFGWNWPDISDYWETNAFGRKQNRKDWEQEVKSRCGHDFLWALLQLTEGKSVKRKKHFWQFGVKNGQLYCDDSVYNILNIHKDHIKATDWEIVVQKILLKDVQLGQRFNIDTKMNCLKISSEAYPNAYIYSDYIFCNGLNSENKEVKLVKE